MIDIAFYLLWLQTALHGVPERHILIVGDSEAAMVCPHTDEVAAPLDEVTCDYKGGTVINHWGQWGRLHAAMQRWHRSHPGIEKPDYIVLFLGTNDHWRRYDQVPDLGPILREIRDIPCVWVGPVAVEGKRSTFTDGLRAEVEARCMFVESEDIELWDGWHPRKKAIVPWLQRVWSAFS